MIEDRLTLVSFEITGVCQNRCIHCYYFNRPHVPKFDMPLEKYKKVIDEIAKELLYPTDFGYRGGEPTLHKDFFEVVKYTRETLSDFRIHLSTNGIRLANKDFAKKLLDLDAIDGYQVTFHSHIKEIHEKITQFKGSWESALQAVKNLLNEGVHVWTNTPLSRLNKDHILDTVKFLAELGLEHIVVNKAIFVYKYNDNISKLMLTPEEFGVLCYRIKKLAENLGIHVKFAYSFPLCLFNPHHFSIDHYVCGLGKGVLEINPAGDIGPCSFTAIKYGNIFREGLDHAWNHSKQAMFWKNKEVYLAKVSPKCLKCRLLSECGGIGMCEYAFLKNRIKPVI